MLCLIDFKDNTDIIFSYFTQAFYQLINHYVSLYSISFKYLHDCNPITVRHSHVFNVTRKLIFQLRYFFRNRIVIFSLVLILFFFLLHFHLDKFFSAPLILGKTLRLRCIIDLSWMKRLKVIDLTERVLLSTVGVGGNIRQTLPICEDTWGMALSW